MNVLLVESDENLREIWSNHLRRRGGVVLDAASLSKAIEILRIFRADVIVVDIELKDGSGIVVSDYADYRYPNAKVVVVSQSGFFSDGSIFNMSRNVCAMMPGGVEPEDLGEIVEHYSMH